MIRSSGADYSLNEYRGRVLEAIRDFNYFLVVLLSLFYERKRVILEDGNWAGMFLLNIVCLHIFW